uniref:Uncharacterized protein n=1 Tax=Glossina palpalis gambiensis TaxID=67801 RepID=A0A1B0C5Z8_9MUSC
MDHDYPHNNKFSVKSQYSIKNHVLQVNAIFCCCIVPLILAASPRSRLSLASRKRFCSSARLRVSSSVLLAKLSSFARSFAPSITGPTLVSSKSSDNSLECKQKLEFEITTTNDAFNMMSFQTRGRHKHTVSYKH